MGEPAIAIPCFIHNNHWVALAHREINGRVVFLCTDDLNNPSIAQLVKQIITKETCSQFCPPDATWITCRNYTYTPHTNECGPRMLLALTIFLTHPVPHPDILMPYMHPNLAQITWTHIALTILTGRIIIPSATDSYISVPGVATRMRSNPASLINWHTIDGDGMHIPLRSVGNFTSLDYPPTPTPLQACSPLTPSSFSNATAQSETLSASCPLSSMG